MRLTLAILGCDNPGFWAKTIHLKINFLCYFKILNHDFQSNGIIVILEKYKVLSTK